MTSETRNPTTSLALLLERADARRVALPKPAMRRLLRVRAGLTQAEIAELVGVKRNAVTRWENGTRNPRGHVRTAYAELLEALTTRGGGHV